MATEDTELPIPQNEGEGDDTVIPVNPVVLEDVRAPRELNEDRYQLKVPNFTGEEEVEQFIQKFQDVMGGKAKPYGLGPDINSIFASLRARFGISAIDARARLQRLRLDPHMSLQEHAATVIKLVQIAYSDLPQAVKGILMMPLCSPSTTWGSITSFWQGESPRSRAPSLKEKHTSWRQVDMEPSAAPGSRLM